MARKAYDTGVSICRPLYYSHPGRDEAYEWKEEFMFGDNILATVLCQPLDSLSGKTERKMWFPTGSDWYDMAHRKMHKGGSVKTLYYGIEENPWYVKAGTIIPLAEEGIQSLQEQNSVLRLFIAPGEGAYTYRHYEDDGISQAYDEDYAITEFRKRCGVSSCVLEIGAREGNYDGMPQERIYIIVMGGLEREPKSVLLNGSERVECQYDSVTREATFALPAMYSEKSCKVIVKY
jgi:alpha-glucosidase (family GH31 glycosyl hydrolase)